jgi:UDP-N-acetylmuramate dehydrogenase
MIDIHTNIPLKNYTTMRLGGPARFMAEVRSIEELTELCGVARTKQLPIVVIGGGSNIVANDDGFAGVVIRIRLPGFEIINDDLNTTSIKVGAGENWDETVKKTVEMNLTGMEALSSIPGTVGASPVQNIGAYGQEVSETITAVEALDLTTNSVVTLNNEQCQFAYRDSIFRNSEKGRYVITAVTFTLSKNTPQPPFYEAVQAYFDAHSVSLFTPRTVRDAVVAIRSEKLPDPDVFPNCGSFFKNAIVEDWRLKEIQAAYPTVPSYAMADGRVKIPSGWLIETVGLKGQLLHGMKVHDKNALVLINESAHSYAELAAAREAIIGKVRDTFHIVLEQEPLELADLAN